MQKHIWVFASNLAGRHGKGSALEARLKHGAIYGRGYGPQGNSYAIPTKGQKLEILPIKEITEYVNQFLDYAKAHPDVIFDVVKIGTGLAGYTDEEMAPLFRNRTTNVHIHNDWILLLDKMERESSWLLKQ